METTGQRLLGLTVLLGALLLLLLAVASPQAHSTSTAVLITAVYYDTYLPDEPDEAFRLTNVSTSPVDLNGWEITDGEGTIALVGTLNPGQSFWITWRAAEFKQEFGFAPNYQFGGVIPMSPTSAA